MSEATERCTASVLTAIVIMISRTARTVFLDTLAVDSLLSTGGIKIAGIAFICWTVPGLSIWARFHKRRWAAPVDSTCVHDPVLQGLRWRLVTRAIRHQGAALFFARPAEELIRHKL